MPELLGWAFLLTGFLVDLDLAFNPWQYRKQCPPTPLTILCVLYLLGSDQGRFCWMEPRCECPTSLPCLRGQVAQICMDCLPSSHHAGNSEFGVDSIWHIQCVKAELLPSLALNHPVLFQQLFSCLLYQSHLLPTS